MNDRTELVWTEWLLLRCQQGDQSALDELVAHWHPHMMRFATVVTRDPDQAQEAVQDAWIAVIRGLPRLRNPATFRTWIFRIVHNKCRDLARRRPAVDAAAPEPTGRIYLNRFEDSEEVSAFLASLSEDHRVVLALHYLQDVSVAEIAAALDIPVGTVKSRLHHAREAFRVVLKQAREKEEGNEPARRENSPRPDRERRTA